MNRSTLVAAAGLVIALAACGSAGKAEQGTTTKAPTTEAPTTKAPSTTDNKPGNLKPCHLEGNVSGNLTCTDGQWRVTPPPTTAAPTTTAAPVPPAPTDFTVTLAVTGQQCFGSAGCNVTVRPSLAVVGVNGLNKAASITFQIDGDESGPIIQTIDVTATGSYTQREVNMSTSGAGVVPTATVTAVH